MVQKNINIQNKKARFEFEILDKFVAGIQLTGTEIKSIRLSQARITESFCEFNERGELFIVNMYIQEYLFGHHFNHKPKSERRLLLNKKGAGKMIHRFSVHPKRAVYIIVAATKEKSNRKVVLVY